MSAIKSAMDALNAQWFNTVTAALELSPKEFQVAQGDLILPTSTARLWSMMDALATPTVAQVYTEDTLVAMSGEYTTMLSDVQVPSGAAFEKEMGQHMAAWQTALTTYLTANAATAYANMPDSLTKATAIAFQEWSATHLPPGQAAKAYSLLRATAENPITIGQNLQLNLGTGGEAAYITDYATLLKDISMAPSTSFSMDSATASTDISNSWANSSSSTGGSYFYSESSSSQSSAFTQTVASSHVTVETSYGHLLTVPVVALSQGSVVEGSTTYLPWFYGAALATAYKNDVPATWIDPTQWATLFSSTGSFQYVVTALIVADDVNTTITSMATFSQDEQTFSNTQSNEGYGCWPYYVSNSSDKTTSTNSVFNDAGALVVTTTSKPGHPLVIGVLVSSVASLVTE